MNSCFFIRAWSSLAELENPTSFGDFFKPEPDLNPIFCIPSNPMKPEPKVQTREYPKCMKTLKKCIFQVVF